jgi:hypothetical protein
MRKDEINMCVTHGRIENANTIWMEILKGRNHAGGLGVCGMIILKLWIEFSWLRICWNGRLS